MRRAECPRDLKIASACRLGYPTAARDYTRVRREVRDFAHYNGYGKKDLG